MGDEARGAAAIDIPESYPVSSTHVETRPGISSLLFDRRPVER